MLSLLPSSRHSALKCAFSTTAAASNAVPERMHHLMLKIPKELQITMTPRQAAVQDSNKWQIPKSANPPRQNLYPASSSSSNLSLSRPRRKDRPTRDAQSQSQPPREARAPRGTDGETSLSPRRASKREPRETGAGPRTGPRESAPRDGESRGPRGPKDGAPRGERMRRVSIIQEDGTAAFVMEPYGARRGGRKDGEGGGGRGKDRFKGTGEAVELETGAAEKETEKPLRKREQREVMDPVVDSERMMQELMGGSSLLGAGGLEGEVEASKGQETDVGTEGDGKKWDGGKAARAAAAASKSKSLSYESFLPTLSSSGSLSPTQAALEKLKWILGTNPTVSRSQQEEAVKLIEARFGGGVAKAKKGGEKRA